MNRLPKIKSLDDVFEPAITSDLDLLIGTLDAFLPKSRVIAYAGVMVPQIGPAQGKTLNFSHNLKGVSEEIRSFIEENSMKHNVDIIQSRTINIKQFKESSLHVTFCSIAKHYDINIGFLAVVGQKPISKQRLGRVLDFYEATLSYRKKSIALSNQGELLSLDVEQREELDYEIGQIIHKSIQPIETRIYAPSSISDSDEESDINFDLRYSSSQSITSFDLDDIKIRETLKDGDPIILNDAKSTLKSADMFGSSVYFPISDKSRKVSYAVICCHFNRKNAVSKIEVEIIKRYADLLRGYYRLWYQRAQSEEALKETKRVFELSKRSLLIADIMHDMTQDIVSVNSGLDLAHGRDKEDDERIDRARGLLADLKVSARQFRKILRGTKVVETESGAFALRGSTHDRDYGEISFADLIERVKHKYRRDLADAKITVDNQTSKALKLVGFERTLFSVFANIVQNSIIHLRRRTHIQRRIHITLASERNPASGTMERVISVRDNGPGSNEKNLQNLLTQFVTTRESDGDGMGLGLAIVDAGCSAHGGRCELRSEWGKFFEVRLHLPDSAVKL